ACTSLTSITIGNGVTSIGRSAFNGCTSLTTIEVGAANVNYTDVNGVLFNKEKTLLHTYPADKTGDNYVIPDGVTTIGNDAFRGCTNLRSIAIPNSVTSIGSGAFNGCTSLTSITIPNSVTSIGDYAFRDCNSLTSVTIPDGVTLIADGTFLNCTSLTSITIGNGVNSIGDDSFSDCTSLTSITIPDSVTSIGDDSFSDCTSLTSITIGYGVNSIGEASLYGCTSLTSVTIGNGVTSIGNGAFYICSSLTSIVIPDSVTSIGRSAFYGCTSLTSITFQGDAPTDVGSKAFAGLPDGAVALVTIEALSSFGESGSSWNGLTLEVIPVLSWITNNEEVTITGCDTAATGELVIPDTIEGNPVTSIGASAFRDCTSLTRITIPDGVTSIGVAAFRGCASLTSMTIPDSVTSIGGAAFFSCTRLTRITIPDGVTSIENGSFRVCTSLTSITIPDSVTSIGQSAFRDCTSLTSITFLGTAPTVGNDAFSGVKDGPIAVVTIGNQASFGDLGTDWNGLTVNMSVSDMITALNAQNAAVATARTAGRGDVTNDPTSYNLVTQTSYNTVVAERDARFTEDQIRTMSVDHTVGQNEAGNMQVKIAFVQSTDLNTYIPFTVTPDSLSVVDGKICMEFPPSDAENFFFRFGFHNPEPAIVVQ
ncbi:leucine-rich repeat domain-containing protein, partial [Akkermansiaceae bacterium]|nr:leucine-rich repeat domain-containing protein [Akkermansiaceae bacterium]